MRLATTFFTLALALNVLATPIGDHAVFRRHTGTIPARNARRYILQSRMDAPPACVAKASAPSNVTDVPDLTNSTVTDPTVTDVPSNTTTTDGTLGTPDTTGNSTDTSLTDTTGNSTDTSTTDTTGTDNSTVSDTSNSTDASSTRRRRRGIVSTSHVISTTTTSSTLSIVDLAFEWQNLCLLSGGGVFIDNSPCVHIAGSDGFNALLADADPCAQQTFADSIITFAKSPGILNKDSLIAFALKYRRHPRIAQEVLGVMPSSLYCLTAPINPELHGIVNAQPDGVNPGLFGSPSDPMVPFGSDGTCPLGTTADVSTCSCVPDTTGNSTDFGTLSDGTSADNSTVTDTSDPSATSTDNSTLSDPSATVSASDASATDASATASADDSTVTDAAASTSDATATDSAVSDAAAPTDSASATDSNASLTAVDGSPVATGSPSDISGNINDPNGRRK